MSRKATDASGTDESGNDSAIFRATVVFPDPVPPAMPMNSGFTIRRREGSIAGDDASTALQIKARVLSRYCIGHQMSDVG